MKLDGAHLHEVTSVRVLTACRYVDIVDEGWRHFQSMPQDYGVVPTIVHYNCMVHMLGRAGRRVEAEDFIKSMPIAPDVTT
ncbi:hypothetical protein M758_10G010100 [Ceratodon purpureus]|uniref:Pentatricopeptide repeat-containing protein n=1 Tax=Ceratodon purpureus TaxID=3225 RepID=A0A8T0GHX0_CERPU|nr:hypothetical protein KC19_10G010800 [Ceratodon purpureus]KAG0602365.1 hypothetical protein M758_10G010100 [Ceratodon purpureus]